MRSLTTLSIASMLAAGATTGAMAQTFTATNTANVGSTESSSKISLSAKSRSNPTNPGNGRFVIVDVNGVEVSPAPITSLTLTFTEFSGKYAESGPLNFFLTSDTTPLVGNGSEGFTYKGDGPTNGIGTQLGTLTFLGTKRFSALPYVKGKTTTARVSYTFTLTSAQQSALVADMRSGVDVKFALGVSPGATTETEFYGAAYSTTTIPTLTLNTQ